MKQCKFIDCIKSNKKIIKNMCRYHYNKWYADKYPELHKKSKQKWLELNKEKRKQIVKNWELNNKEKRRKYINEYNRERVKTDIKFKIKRNLRCRLNQALQIKNLKRASKRTEEILGCNIEQLKKHLEIQFKEGMTWDNYGKWHIDHILPSGSAKTLEELYQLNHYTNLQPLWEIDNRKKVKFDKLYIRQTK